MAVIAAVLAPFACAAGVALGASRDEAPQKALGDVRLKLSAPELPKAGPVWPDREAVANAEKIAEGRKGLVSFAAIGPKDRKVGFASERQFFSASVSKAMLLVAELRRLERDGSPLDAATRSLLTQMITFSDNAAADSIYARVGDAGLNELAKSVGMTHFSGDVGHWSNVQFSAGDLALFMSKIDALLDLPGGDAASKMLASVIPSQAWGIPQATPDKARVRFKGGWRPTDSGELVHQMARVDVNGESYSLAVLTDGNPSMPYGEETIRLIAAQLLQTKKG